MSSQALQWTFERSPWDSSKQAATFSVGVFQWVPSASGKGLKRSKTIRVAGYTADPKAVYREAEELCRRLNKERASSVSPPKWLQKQYSVPKPGPARLAAHPACARKLAMRTAKDRVADMARDVLEPQFKPMGFCRRGRVFWRDSQSVCHVISLNMSRWGSASDSSFDVMLGVFWHDVEAVLKNPSAKKMPPSIWDCTFQMDLGFVMPGRWFKSWDVKRNTDLAKIGQRVLRQLLRLGLPWLEYRNDMRHTLEADRRTRGARDVRYEHSMGNSRIVFLVKLGKHKEAQRLLDECLPYDPSGRLRHAAKMLKLKLN